MAFYFHPELGTLGSRFSFFGKSNLEHLDCLSDSILNVSLSKSDLLAALGIVVEIEVVVFV